MNHLVLKATRTKRGGFSSSSDSSSSTPFFLLLAAVYWVAATIGLRSPPAAVIHPSLTLIISPLLAHPIRRCDIRHPGCQQKREDGWNAKAFPLWSSVTSLAYWNAFSTSYLSGPCKHPIISNHFAVRSATALHSSHAMWSIPVFWHPGKSYLMISKGGNVSCQRRLPENRV